MGKISKKTSLQDIADYLQVSKNAVSLALNDRPGVSDDLRKKVYAAAEVLHYNGFAMKKKSKNIFVFIPEYIINDTYFYNEIYWAIEKEAKAQQYNAFLTCVTNAMQEQRVLPDIFYQVDCGGIIAIGVFREEYIRMIDQLSLPLMIVDNSYDHIQLDTIVSANEDGAYLAVEHLIENGHRSIGFIGSIEVSSSFYERWLGYRKAMKKFGCTIDEGCCILHSTPLNDLLTDVTELKSALEKMKHLPSAWFCGGDRIAIALIYALNQMNLQVPRDVSVVGFDDIQASRYTMPPLTTIKTKRAQMGEEAVRYLISKAEQAGEKRKIAFYGELVMRDSVRNLTAAGELGASGA